MPEQQYKYIEVADFKPLPKQGHLSAKIPAYEAAAPAIRQAYAPLADLEFAAVREVAGDPDAVIPPGGPDRYKDVTTELVNFTARDGNVVELKIYKSPNVKPDAVLMYRMHGGGKAGS